MGEEGEGRGRGEKIKADADRRVDAALRDVVLGLDGAGGAVAAINDLLERIEEEGEGE